MPPVVTLTAALQAKYPGVQQYFTLLERGVAAPNNISGAEEIVLGWKLVLLKSPDEPFRYLNRPGSNGNSLEGMMITSVIQGVNANAPGPHGAPSVAQQRLSEAIEKSDKTSWAAVMKSTASFNDFLSAKRSVNHVATKHVVALLTALFSVIHDRVVTNSGATEHEKVEEHEAILMRTMYGVVKAVRREARNKLELDGRDFWDRVVAPYLVTHCVSEIGKKYRVPEPKTKKKPEKRKSNKTPPPSPSSSPSRSPSPKRRKKEKKSKRSRSVVSDSSVGSAKKDKGHNQDKVLKYKQKFWKAANKWVKENKNNDDLPVPKRIFESVFDEAKEKNEKDYARLATGTFCWNCAFSKSNPVQVKHKMHECEVKGNECNLMCKECDSQRGKVRAHFHSECPCN